MNDRQETTGSRIPLSVDMRREIDDFLTDKRRAVVFTLAEDGEDVQGDLASKIGSPVNSLANIIQKFEGFKHKLLESERAGKYRRYRLSELGWAYVEGGRQADGESSDADLDETERQLLQEAEISLACFRERYRSDSWKEKMDDALLWRIRNAGSADDELSEASEKQVNRYLACLEQLDMQESHEVYRRVKELLESEILQVRAEAYMAYFRPFIPLLRQLEDRRASFDMRMMLSAAFHARDPADAMGYIEAAEWKPNEYNALKETAKKLRRITANYDERRIYLLFQGLLPGLDDLSFYLAQLIYGQHTSEKAEV